MKIYFDSDYLTTEELRKIIALRRKVNPKITRPYMDADPDEPKEPSDQPEAPATEPETPPDGPLVVLDTCDQCLIADAVENGLCASCGATWEVAA